MTFKIVTVLFFLFASLFPFGKGIAQESQEDESRLSMAAVHQLVHRELENDVIATTMYESLDLRRFLAQIGLMMFSGRAPSAEEQGKLQAAFKNTISFVVKEVASETFWDEKLSQFLVKNLSTREVEDILRIYPALDQSPAGRKLIGLRPLFIAEVALALDAVVKARIRSFKIPSGAMIPTLLIGDHIVVDKSAYRSKKPERGDVIVFLYPEDETKVFIKRIIALPGDSYRIRNKVVYINEEPLDDRAFTQHVDPGIIEGAINPRDNFGPLTVPEGAYFVLGDNRDQSLDSRFWGYVKVEKIIGKVWMIYWSWEDDSARWERIGTRFQ